jgi:hypothetical protein
VGRLEVVEKAALGYVVKANIDAPSAVVEFLLDSLT